MKKLALLLLICFSFLAASAQTTPVSPKGPLQASPYHEASTNRMWLFNPTFGWFVIPDSTYIKKFIGADTLRFKAGQFKNIGTSTAVKIALQTDTQKTGHIYYLGFDPTSKNLRYDTTQFGTGGSTIHASNGLSLSGDTVKLGGSITKDTVVTVTANHQFRIGDTPSGNGLYVSRGSDSSMNVALGGGSQSSPIYGFFAVGGNGAIDIEAGNGSVDKSIQIDPTPSTGGMSIHDSDHLGLANAADYSTQIKLHPYALVQTNMLNARADSIISAVGGGLKHAANGLHLSVDTVKLGGNITEYTPITVNPNTQFGIGDPDLSGYGLNMTRSIDSSLSINIAGGSYISPYPNGYVAVENTGKIDIESRTTGGSSRGIFLDPRPTTGGMFIVDWEHKGLVGNELFPKYSGKQYAQIHGVDSIAKAKADSVKGTISSGVSTFNTRTGAVTLLSADVTSALGFTPENVANKATSFSTINNTLYPSVQAVNTKLGNYVPLVGGVTITGEVQDSYTPLAANDLARLTDLGLVPTVLTGMTVTVSGTTATIASGTYRLNNITYTYAGGTITIPAQDATQYRYSILYITTVGVISITNGALVAADPVVPDFPANSVEVSIIYIPPTGGTVTTGGGGSKSTGTVTVFSFVNANGFTGSVANATTKPALTLTLKTILPSVVAQTGLGTAGTDSVMVKHSGLMQAIAPGYYLAATTASSTYVPLTRTVNGKALSSNITLGLASSDFANQGTTTGLLHGNASGNPSFGPVVNADITNATIDLTTKVTSILPVANGGTGTSTPGIVAGTNITVTGTWPNQTVNASGGSFTNPMTTTGDIIYSSSGSTPARLGIGSTNQILRVSGGLPSWQPQSAIGTAAATASTIMARDTNANTAINNLNQGYTTTATAGLTTTLTVASTYIQVFTGSAIQALTLPVASTLVLGTQYYIYQAGSNIITVNSSGGNLVVSLSSTQAAIVTCILTSGTSAASWAVQYLPISSIGSINAGSANLGVNSVTSNIVGSGTVQGINGNALQIKGAVTTGGTTGVFVTGGTAGIWQNSSGLAQTFGVTPTYNQTSTAGSIDFLINRTETVLGSGVHKFFSFQIAGSEKMFADNKGNLSSTSLRGVAVTFANLPSTPVEGMLVPVTDSSVNTWGSTITGSGSNHVLAYWNGTNWTVAGK